MIRETIVEDFNSVKSMCIPTDREEETERRETESSQTETDEERQKRLRKTKRHRECKMQLCFVAHLEPTRMRWEKWSSESDKSENKGSKCAGVQRCRVCVQFNTHPQLGLALRPS